MRWTESKKKSIDLPLYYYMHCSFNVFIANYHWRSAYYSNKENILIKLKKYENILIKIN